MRRASLFLVASALLLVLCAGVAFARTFEGTDGPDRIGGTNSADLIFGKAANDFLAGRGGRDRILGQSGDDTIRGGPGRDRLSGGPGNDTIRGGADQDSINGGGGDDVIVVSDDGNTPDQVACGSGTDTVYAFGKDHSSLLSNPNCEDIISFRGTPQL